MDEKTSNMKTAFGLDLAGYSGGNTGFARVYEAITARRDDPDVGKK